MTGWLSCRKPIALSGWLHKKQHHKFMPAPPYSNMSQNPLRRNSFSKISWSYNRSIISDAGVFLGAGGGQAGGKNYGICFFLLALTHGNADVTSVRNVRFSHLRMSQQFFNEVTDACLELSAEEERAWRAKNIKWIQIRGWRVFMVKKVRLYRQCSPRPWQAKCSFTNFLARLSVQH